jgi:hypothetical protein
MRIRLLKWLKKSKVGSKVVGLSEYKSGCVNRDYTAEVQFSSRIAYR